MTGRYIEDVIEQKQAELDRVAREGLQVQSRASLARRRARLFELQASIDALIWKRDGHGQYEYTRRPADQAARREAD